MSADALWTIDELVAATGGTMIGDKPEFIGGVSIDTRTLSKGDIYVAIKGEHMDGHTFVYNAMEQGASLVIVRRGVVGSERTPRLEVDDPLRAMEAIGVAARARSKAKIVAVTGSVGKTSTKEALRLGLARDGLVHASVASYNNHWGVPLTLARFPAQSDFGVFEVGMNHPGEIEPLSRMIRPDVAIITNVEPVHIGHFNSVEEIADAKAEVFAGMTAEGVAVLNRDNAFFEHLSTKAKAAGVEKVISFGEHEDSDTRLDNFVLHSSCSCVSASVCGQDVTYKLGAPGRHLVINSLAVLSAVVAVGGDLALAALALGDVKAPKGRGERSALAIDDGYFVLIDESYNANPASMRAAIATLKNAKTGPGGRRIAVMGDMLELGAGSPGLHEELAPCVVDADVDMVFVCGKDMQRLWDALPRAIQGAYAADSDGLADAIVGAVRPGDVIMIKGSLGSRMGPLVGVLKDNFDAAGDEPAKSGTG